MPASIRSGITSWKALWRCSTPLIVIVSVPAPLILAPILFKKVATFTISGSLAAFSIVVTPFALVATSKALIVAPTLGISRYILFPFNSSAVIVYLFSSSIIVAPNER